jgi:hypothetical protein
MFGPLKNSHSNPQSLVNACIRFSTAIYIGDINLALPSAGKQHLESASLIYKCCTLERTSIKNKIYE